MDLTDEMLDAGVEHLPLRLGCTCRWDEHGNRPSTCRCAERSLQHARENVREIVEAVLAADPRNAHNVS